MTPNDNLYLPRWSKAQVGLRYIGIFKIYENENWRTVQGGDRKKRYFDTPEAAFNAAKETVSRIINGNIRADRSAIEEKPDALQSDVLEWRQKRDIEAREERERVFEGNGPKTVFNKTGRPVAVETKGKRI